VQLVSTKYGVAVTPIDVNQDHFTDLLVVYYTCEVGKDIRDGAFRTTVVRTTAGPLLPLLPYLQP
jgi:hypothetical protein